MVGSCVQIEKLERQLERQEERVASLEEERKEGFAIWETKHRRYEAFKKFATRFLYPTLGPPLRREGNTRQITDIGHLWANVGQDSLWELTLQVFRHHNLMIPLQVQLFNLDLKHIDVYPSDKVIRFCNECCLAGLWLMFECSAHWTGWTGLGLS